MYEFLFFTLFLTPIAHGWWLLTWAPALRLIKRGLGHATSRTRSE